MRKSIKKVAATLLAATMVLGTLTTALAEDGKMVDGENTYFADLPEDEVRYTIAGGCAPGGWVPLNTVNEMTETLYKGVYSIKVELNKYNEAEPWNNQFKITKIDEETSMVSLGEDGKYNWGGFGWSKALCLGTEVWDDNQSQFCIMNPNDMKGDMKATIYVDINSGAVIVRGPVLQYDADGNVVKNDDGTDKYVDEVIPYSVSWVGYDKEQIYVDVEDIPTTKWAEDKIKVEKIPTAEDLKAKNEMLNLKATNSDLSIESLYEDGYKYTIAGGCAANGWNPQSSINEMKESEIKGVYTFKMSVPAFAEETEWQNRFKICRLDDVTCWNGWLGSLCLGTDRYDDCQTTFRLEVAEATDVTVYFQPETGAVLILDAEGKEVDYKFSWVGYDNEVQYTTVSEFASCGYKWPEDKVKTDAPTDLADKYAAFAKLVKEGPQKEEPTTVAPTTAAPTTAAPTTAAPTTTAQNQATQTGDAAPVALLFLLVASVAVVTVVAKKKEA